MVRKNYNEILKKCIEFKQFVKFRLFRIWFEMRTCRRRASATH